MLIDPKAVVRIIRNSFDGTVESIFVELLQNSQRAKATQVNITSDATSVTYKDNGKGLESIVDFERLVWLGLSGWDSKTNKDQHPYGVGFYAVLANEKISTVSVTSKGRRLTIDTYKWWNDESYCTNWQSLLEVVEDDNFTTISMVPVTDLTTKCDRIFTTKRSYNTYPPYVDNIVAGYEKYFKEVTYNNNRLPLGDWKPQLKVLLTTDYLGNELTIYQSIDRFKRQSCVYNHYGQLATGKAEVNTSGINAVFSLDIVSGTPLDFKSPTRSGPIENNSWNALQKYVLDTTASYLNNPKLCTLDLDPDFLSDFYSYYKDKLPTCPYYVGRACNISKDWLERELLTSISETEYFLSASKLYKYSDSNVVPVLSTIHIAGIESYRQGWAGLECFLPSIPNSIVFTAGDSDRANVRQVFIDAGEIQTYEVTKPQSLLWKANDNESWQECDFPVFCCESTYSSVDSAADIIAFLPEPLDDINNFKYLMSLGLDRYPEERTYEDLLDDFHAEYPLWARQYYPDSNTISADFTLKSLEFALMTATEKHPKIWQIVPTYLEGKAVGIEVNYSIGNEVKVRTFKFL